MVSVILQIAVYSPAVRRHYCRGDSKADFYDRNHDLEVTREYKRFGPLYLRVPNTRVSLPASLFDRYRHLARDLGEIGDRTLEEALAWAVEQQWAGIPADVFLETIHHVSTINAIQQPIIANLTVGCQNFVDDRIEGFRTVAFDNAVTGERRFCRCNFDAHRRMLSEAKGRAPAFATGSWPHRVIALLDSVVYADGLCHFCVSERHGKEAPSERYGPEIRKHYGPYIDLLVRTANIDLRTAKAETKHRLALSRWVREEELYGVVRRLFPNEIVRREGVAEMVGAATPRYLPAAGGARYRASGGTTLSSD